MKPDEPHVFDPIPEVPMSIPAVGEVLLSIQPLAGVVGMFQSQMCQICKKPENDRLHLPVKDESAPEHWG